MATASAEAGASPIQVPTLVAKRLGHLLEASTTLTLRQRLFKTCL
jgi:hypothetical protein